MTYPVHTNTSYCIPNQPVGVNQVYVPPQQYNIPQNIPAYPQGSGYPAPGVSYPSPQNAYFPQGANPSYGVGPPPAYPNMPPAQPMYYPQQQSGAYDPAARFGKGSSYNIPPPPPGVAPNAAQMAAAQGQNVTMHQQSADWVSGPPGGGSTFW
ncbi:DAZ-associated protein 2 isoform X3 [Hydra vulgaris]